MLLIGGEADKSDNRTFYPLHLHREEDLPSSHWDWWDDIPLGPQGAHDGKPDALRAKETKSK